MSGSGAIDGTDQERFRSQGVDPSKKEQDMQTLQAVLLRGGFGTYSCPKNYREDPHDACAPPAFRYPGQ